MVRSPWSKAGSCCHRTAQSAAERLIHVCCASDALSGAVEQSSGWDKTSNVEGSDVHAKRGTVVAAPPPSSSRKAAWLSKPVGFRSQPTAKSSRCVDGLVHQISALREPALSTDTASHPIHGMNSFARQPPIPAGMSRGMGGERARNGNRGGVSPIATEGRAAPPGAPLPPEVRPCNAHPVWGAVPPRPLPFRSWVSLPTRFFPTVHRMLPWAHLAQACDSSAQPTLCRKISP